MDRPLGGQHIVFHRQRRHHHVGGIAMQAVERDVEVGLLRLGRNAGGGTATHDVEDHQRHLGAHRVADGLELERQTGAGGGGQRGHAAVGGADRHLHRRDLVFGLAEHAADGGEARRHPFQQVGGRGDRIERREADATLEGAVAGGLIAGDHPALGLGGAGATALAGAVGELERRRRSVGRRQLQADVEAGADRLTALFDADALVDQGRGHGLDHRLDRQADQRRHRAQRNDVRPGAANVFGQLGEGGGEGERAIGRDLLRHLAGVIVGDGHALRPERNFSDEALDVAPVEGDQDVELVTMTVDRPPGQTDQRRRLAAANLRTDGARHQPIPAGLASGLQQQGAGGDRARAAAAGDGDRNGVGRRSELCHAWFL